MALTHEQIQELKKQLSQQIQHLPPGQKEQAQEQIDSMSGEALESMLNQQRTQVQQKSGGKEKGVFRMIVDGEIKARKIDENKEAIAVLDIRPFSKGHTIVIPKKPVDDARKLPPLVFSLAKIIAKRMASKLKASGTEIQTESKFGEAIVNVIPNYGKQITERYEASEQELDAAVQALKVVVKPKVEKIKKEKKKEENVLKLKRRIP